MVPALWIGFNEYENRGEYDEKWKSKWKRKARKNPS